MSILGFKILQTACSNAGHRFTNASEFGWVLASQVLAALGGLLTLKVLTQLLPIQEFGMFAIWWSVNLAAVALLFDPLAKTALRFAVDTCEGDTSDTTVPPYNVSSGTLEVPNPASRPLANNLPRINPDFSAAFRKLQVRVAVSVATTGLIIGGIGLTFWGAEYLNLAVAILLLVLTHGTCLNVTLVAVAFRKRQLVAAIQALLGLLRPALAAAFVLAAATTAAWALIGQAVAFAIVSALLLSVLGTQVAGIRSLYSAQKSVGGDTDRKSISTVSAYAYALMASASLSVISLYSDRWLAATVIDVESAGLYAAIALIVSGPLFGLHSTVYRFAAPFAFAVQRTGTGVIDPRVWTTIKSALFLWAVFLIPLFIACLLFHEWIVTLATTAAYAANSSLLPVLVFGIGLERSGSILELVGQYVYHTRPYVAARLTHVICLIGVSLILMPVFGIAGLAFAHAVSSILYVAVVLYCNKRLAIH